MSLRNMKANPSCKWTLPGTIALVSAVTAVEQDDILNNTSQGRRPACRDGNVSKRWKFVAAKLQNIPSSITKMNLQEIDPDKLPFKCMGKFGELCRRYKHMWNGRIPEKGDVMSRELLQALDKYSDLHSRNGRRRRPAPYLNHPSSPHKLKISQENIDNAGSVILQQENVAVDDECLGMSSSSGSDEKEGPGELQTSKTPTEYRLKCGKANADYCHKFTSSDDDYSDSSLKVNVHHHCDEPAFDNLIVDHPPQQPLFKYLYSDSEGDDYQLADGCRPITTSLLSEPKVLEVAGEGKTWGRMNDDHKRHRASSRGRMNFRKVRLRTSYSPKLQNLQYEDSRLESDFGSDTNVCDSNQESESIQDHELRRRAAAASAGEWIRPNSIPLPFFHQSRQDLNLKGCSNHIEVPRNLTTEAVDSAVLKLQSSIAEEILHLGRELRTQIIKSETKNRKNTKRTCKFHSFLLQERVGNLFRMRNGFLRGRISENVNVQVQQLENHLVEKLTKASSILRQVIENHIISSTEQRIFRSHQRGKR